MAEGCDVITKSCQIYWHGLDLYHDMCTIMDIGATIICLVMILNIIACSNGRLIQVHDGYQRHGGSRRSSPTSSSECHGGSRGSSPRGSSPTSSASATHRSRRPACLPTSSSSGNATRQAGCGECAASGGAPPLARKRRNAQCHVNRATANSV